MILKTYDVVDLAYSFFCYIETFQVLTYVRSLDLIVFLSYILDTHIHDYIHLKGLNVSVINMQLLYANFISGYVMTYE